MTNIFEQVSYSIVVKYSEQDCESLLIKQSQIKGEFCVIILSFTITEMYAKEQGWSSTRLSKA
ncbi:hypothetical protein HH214_11895 [Mucilaginibacter robiniae]|uniref:Uncharacterized protein n=1 Tax=Mucilaginibacter robiniae TaxID=2728022 RepID=A0A7L5E283_9SPHI|nr:hypothetical protein [Mucilaginibacter robiniae]QJD96527.1 hypothetical protein HH214_11895 [Mucilaginibacter robiniae]